MDLAPRWILDDGPLDQLAAVISTERLGAWPASELWVAAATARASERSPARRRLLELRAGRPEVPVFAVAEVRMGSPSAEVLYRHLRRPDDREEANLAEHESIAWALVEATDAIFVTQDRLAAYLALCELGRGRVATPFELWEELFHRGRIGSGELSRLVERTGRSSQGVPSRPWRLREGLELSPAPPMS